MKLRFPTALSLTLVALAVGPSAQARPPVRTIDLQVGKDQFFRIGKGAHVASDAPEIASVEVLPSDEVLITPKAAGRALVFLMAEATFDAVRVRVRDEGGKTQEVRASEAQLAEARKACPRLKVDRGPEGSSLEADVASGACRNVLLSLFETDEFRAQDVSLLFTEEALREQFAAISARMAKQGLDSVFQIAYIGVTLRIKGKATAAQKLALLRIVYEETPGRVLLDDMVELKEPVPAAVDAGTPAAGP